MEVISHAIAQNASTRIHWNDSVLAPDVRVSPSCTPAWIQMDSSQRDLQNILSGYLFLDPLRPALGASDW